MSRSVCRNVVLVLAVLAVASCRKPVTANLGQPVVLPIKGAVVFRKSDLDLLFRRVLTDTRCPQGANCIAAGEAVVTFDARILRGPTESFDVRLPGGAAPDSAIWSLYQGYRVKLLKLDPAPVAGVTVDSTSYVATIIVELR